MVKQDSFPHSSIYNKQPLLGNTVVFMWFFADTAAMSDKNVIFSVSSATLQKS